MMKEIFKKSMHVNIGPIGVGNSGTFFFCAHDIETMHSLRNLVDKSNFSRSKGERL